VEKEKVCVLGASGFIGGCLEEELSKDSAFDVAGYSSKSCDLLSLVDVKSLFSSVDRDDAIVIASAITRKQDNSQEAMKKNIQMVDNICEALSINQVGIVVFLSTVDVYGIDVDEGLKITESLSLAPNDYYASSKVASEDLLRKICSDLHIPLTILRLNGVYGPCDQNKSTIGLIVQSAVREKRIVISGKGESLRDFIHVEDVCRIVISAIKSKKNVLVNVATGRSYSIREIAEFVRDIMPFPVEIEYKDFNEKAEERIKFLQFDCSVRERAFPDIPMTDLETGVESYIEHVSTIDTFK